MSGILWAALLLLPPALSQQVGDSSSAVYGYPATVDANRVYSSGQKVKVDEPHGVYTGIILMDDYYFLRPGEPCQVDVLIFGRSKLLKIKTSQWRASATSLPV